MTGTELFNLNLASTTVSSGGNNAPAQGTQQAWTVTSSAMFPVAATGISQFHVSDPNAVTEMIAVINVSGTTWTVIRGAESTTPVAHSAGFTVNQVTTTGALTQLRAVDWLNVVTMFGADPTYTTDSTAAIQAALNAAPLGGIVYLPAGQYKVSSSLYIPPQVTLQGSLSSHIDSTTCAIKATAAFSGAAVILMVDQSTGGYSVASNEQRLLNITIDGSAITPGDNIDGLQVQGFVHGFQLDNVQFYYPPSHGIQLVSNGSGNPYSCRMTRVSVTSAGGYGYNLSLATDSTYYDLESIASVKSGLLLAGSPTNTHFTNCRFEYSGFDGITLSGAWADTGTPGGLTFTNCSTDASVENGVNITATGSVPVTFAGMMCRRDGANGLLGGNGYAGFAVNGSNLPVLVENLSVYPGIALNGGTNSPEYGFAAESEASNVMIGSATLHAATTAWYDDSSGNSIGRGPNVIERAGTPSSYTTAYSGLQVTKAGFTFTNPALNVAAVMPADISTAEPGTMLGWNYPMWAISSNATPTQSAGTNATTYFLKTYLPVPVTVTSINFWVASAGVGTVSSAYVGLVNSGGTVAASSANRHADAALTTATSLWAAPLSSPYTAAPGTYYATLLVWMTAGGTNPSLGYSPNGRAGNAGQSAGAYPASQVTSQTAITGPYTLSSNAVTSDWFWVGYS